MNLILLIVAIVCFVIALLTAAAGLSTNFDAWLAGGLLAWALSALPWGTWVRTP